MKRFFRKGAALLLFIALFGFSVTAATVDLRPTSSFFVNDFADVLSTDDEQRILTMGERLQNQTGAQVVAVTVPTTDGTDIHEYAVQLGREWGIGDRENNSGILLLLAVKDRQIDIAVGYGLEGAVTDAVSGQLLDTYAIPHLQSGQYSQGITDTYAALVNEVYIEYGLEPNDGYAPIRDRSTSFSPWLTFGLLIVLMLITRGGGLFWILGGFGPRFHGGSGFHGGGFRGGGGSFGGGGASRRF